MRKSPLKTIILYLYIFLSLPTNGQNEDITTNQFKKADSLLNNRFFSQALYGFEKLTLSEKAEQDPLFHLQCENKKAECYFYLGRLRESIQISKNVLSKIDSQNRNDISANIQAHINLGRNYVKKSNFSDAVEHLTKAISLTQNSKDFDQYLVKIYYELGILFTSNGSNDWAMDFFQKALKYQIEIDEISDLTAALYHRIAVLCFHMGAADLMNDYFMKAVRIRMQLHGQIHPTNMISYNSVGVVFKVSNTVQSIIDSFEDFYNNAQMVQTSFFGNHHPDIANTYLNWGVVKNYQGLSKEAVKLYKQSLKIQMAMYDEDHPDILLNHINIGMAYLDAKAYDSAILYFNQTLAIQKEGNLQKSYYTTIPYYHLGKAHLELEEYEKALDFLQMALITNHRDFQNNDINENPSDEGFLNQVSFLETLHLKSQALDLLAQKEDKEGNLNRAFETFSVCDKVINQLMASYRKETDRIFFGESFSHIFRNAFDVAIQLYQETKNETYLKKAFYYAEKSRSNTLRLFLMESNIQQLTGKGDSLGVEIDWVKSQIASNESVLRKLVNSEVSTEVLQNQEDVLFELKEKLRVLIAKVESQYPEYFNLKYKGTLISVEEIQVQLDSETTLLEYYESNKSYGVFLITKKSFDFIELPGAQDLSDKMNTFNENSSERSLESFVKNGHEVYTSVFKPLEDRIKGNKVILIPYNNLWQLNFELLVSDSSGSSFRSLPYLLNKYAFSYGNSATLLFQKQKEEDINQRCLAYSFTTDESKDGISGSLRNLRDELSIDLPGTRKEIKAISEHFDGDYFYGSTADESTFKESAHEYGLLHLALHGIIDDTNPKNSRLVFSQRKQSSLSTEDNLLYVNEIYALNLNANLAVLSACNTGSGKLAIGEGAMSIGRAFQYAGVRSLVVSQWEASDQVSPQVMEAFYSNLKEGMAKSVALQQAKLTVLMNVPESTSSPAYWGNFILIGDPNSLYKPTNYWWLIILGFSVVLVPLIWLRKTRVGSIKKA